MACLRLFDPVSAFEPHEIILNRTDIKHVWVSPGGNFCVGWSWLEETGKQAFTLFAFREMELVF